ncbi:MAG: hypothetical protein JNK58_00315 [Phycisphaerae bacterium]|nr:hypothetical protein [Phycisphaerae bacterium]
MTKRPVSSVVLIALVAGSISPARGQDSVSVIPGNSDAMVVYDEVAVNRYVVDTVPLVSSWGGAFRIAPLMKAHADVDPLFNTQALGSVAMSADQLTNLTFVSTPYLVWNSAGPGLSSESNTLPLSVNVAAFTRQFGVGFSDFATVETNAVGALIGQTAAEPNRFWVTRTAAAISRTEPMAPNTSTITLGAIDASGNLYVRADNFASGGAQVVGENIVRISLPGRNAFTNTLFFNGTINRGDQTSATFFLMNAGTTTVSTPSAIPASLGSATALILDLANGYRNGGGAGVSSHIASGLGFHRGNPSFSTVNAMGGVGTVASLARTPAGVRTDSLNLFAVSSSGAVVATRGATLPTGIGDGQGFTANLASNAEFRQYLSQTVFRGGNGQVAVGLDPLTGTFIAAATATDPTAGEFIAVARFGASVTWTVAAFEGKAVLDGPTGASIGTIANGSPVAFSAPGADLSGNIYFVAAYQPNVGPQGTALIKAVNTASGYRLERILASGQSFVGANSTRPYTIDRLTLGDSDSVASGTFFSSSVLQPLMPGENPTNAADPRAAGGLIVNAQMTYNNAGTPESYQAVMLIAPQIAAPPTLCTGDANGDNMVSFADVTSVLANFGNTYTPGVGGPGDANFDGVVNFNDVTTVLAHFGKVCETL